MVSNERCELRDIGGSGGMASALYKWPLAELAGVERASDAAVACW
jgi:hypothetical protein